MCSKSRQHKSSHAGEQAANYSPNAFNVNLSRAIGARLCMSQEPSKSPPAPKPPFRPTDNHEAGIVLPMPAIMEIAARPTGATNTPDKLFCSMLAKRPLDDCDMVVLGPLAPVTPNSQ